MKIKFFAVLVLSIQFSHFAHAVKILDGKIELKEETADKAKIKIKEYFDNKENNILMRKRAFEKHDPSVRELENEEYQQRFKKSSFYGDYPTAVEQLHVLCNDILNILIKDFDINVARFIVTLNGVPDGTTQLQVDEFIFIEILNAKN